ncbi:S-adenosyl-L-methionine-dependent methyltransferase [Aspergillus egyptiacus]|nr:S-adenosyl-L-methionine-dependent methyltransferase [Aspergillus egyptiacus]
MSLYYDAVAVLTGPASSGGSFKSRLYNSRTLKASPAQVYALITEAAKWDILLKEVIDQAGILKLEPKVLPTLLFYVIASQRLTPLLSLLLVHDHLLAKNGIAAKASHPLRQAVERHKIRLKGEFTKARVRRGCATIPELKDAVRREKLAAQGASANAGAVYPRWVRINNVRTTLEAQLKTTFASYQRVETLEELVAGDEKQKKMRIDPHIPDLIAVAPGVDFSSSPAYRNGEVILQDKASCFPAYLLLGDTWDQEGDLVDGCAAPGNKTTHMASLLYKAHNNASSSSKKKRAIPSHVFSMDASAVRAKTLQKMVSTAGADPIVTVLQGQDFLALDPTDPRFQNVTALLLDPSCSGSGIIGRDDVPTLILPAGKNPQTTTTSSSSNKSNDRGKKRKRNNDPTTPNTITPPSTTATATADSENDLLPPTSELNPDQARDRLLKLSNLQTRIVEHALSFPAATRITYSTCSVHNLENESVVARILASEVARRRGWRVLRRDEQPVGLRRWKFRGVREGSEESGGSNAGAGAGVEGGEGVELSDEDLEGCLRCWPGDEEGTGGFFVVGFVRDGSVDDSSREGQGAGQEEEKVVEGEEGEEDEWEGFSD